MKFEINYNIKASELIFANLKGKKLMLKSYAGEKLLQIMENTVVESVLVVSSIYHFFFCFLDLPLVMSDGDPILP